MPRLKAYKVQSYLTVTPEQLSKLKKMQADGKHVHLIIFIGVDDQEDILRLAYDVRDRVFFKTQALHMRVDTMERG